MQYRLKRALVKSCESFHASSGNGDAKAKAKALVPGVTAFCNVRFGPV